MSSQELKIKDGYKWFKDQKMPDGKPKYIFDNVGDIPNNFNIEDGIKDFEKSLEVNYLNNIDMNNKIENLKTHYANIDSYDKNTIKIYIYLVKYTNYIESIRNTQEYENLILYFNYVIYYFNSYLYLKQLQYEEKKKKNYKLELSKKILENSEITNNIINKYRSFNNNNIVNTHDYIFIPKIERNIELNQIFGLFTIKIKKILKNNNLNICISKKTFILNLRSCMGENEKAYPEIWEKYWILYKVKKSKIILYIKNAILDIEININNLANDLENCKDRYYFILGSIGSFGKKFETKISQILGTSHRISLIFDKQKKLIYFYDPMDLKQFISDKYGNIINAYYLIFSYLFDAETTKNDYFKENKYDIRVFEGIETQHKELITMNNIFIKELQNIANYWKGTKNSNKDWGGGYCGLWNLLLITMININPGKDIEDIFAFYQKLLNHKDEKKQIFLIKKLIRSFAYHIEQLLNRELDIIPIVKLDINSIDQEKLKFKNINDEEKEISIKDHENSVKDADRTENGDIKTRDLKRYIIPFLSEFANTLLKKVNPLKTESNPEIENYKKIKYAIQNQILFI